MLIKLAVCNIRIYEKYFYEIRYKLSMSREYYVGEEAIQLRGVLKLNYPMERGRIIDWSAVERLIHHTFYTRLRLDPYETHVIVPFYPHWTQQDKEKLLEILFDTFNCPSVTLIDYYKLWLYEKEIPDALFMDFYDDVILISIYKDFIPVSYLFRQINMGFLKIISYARRIFMRNGHTFSTSAERAIVRDILETHAYFTIDDSKNNKNSNQGIEYILPDGEVLKVNEERYQPLEALFDPSIIGLEIEPLDQVILEIMDEEYLDEINFFQGEPYLFLSGIIPQFQHFEERMLIELENHSKFSALIKKQITIPTVLENINEIDIEKYNLYKHIIPKFMYDEIGPSKVLQLMYQREAHEWGEEK